MGRMGYARVYAHEGMRLSYSRNQQSPGVGAGRDASSDSPPSFLPWPVKYDTGSLGGS